MVARFRFSRWKRQSKNGAACIRNPTAESVAVWRMPEKASLERCDSSAEPALVFRTIKATRLSVVNYNTTLSSESLETGTGSSNSLRSPKESVRTDTSSGVISFGEANGTPYIPLVAVGDVNTGVHGALAILAALRYRDRTGNGQHLDVGLLDVYYHCHEVSVHQFSGSKGPLKPSRQGPHLNYLAPAGVFKATGGWVVIMGFLHHWKELWKAMARPALVDDPKLGT